MSGCSTVQIIVENDFGSDVAEKMRGRLRHYFLIGLENFISWRHYVQVNACCAGTEGDGEMAFTYRTVYGRLLQAHDETHSREWMRCNRRICFSVEIGELKLMVPFCISVWREAVKLQDFDAVLNDLKSELLCGSWFAQLQVCWAPDKGE